MLVYAIAVCSLSSIKSATRRLIMTNTDHQYVDTILCLVQCPNELLDYLVS